MTPVPPVPFSSSDNRVALLLYQLDRRDLELTRINPATHGHAPFTGIMPVLSRAHKTWGRSRQDRLFLSVGAMPAGFASAGFESMGPRVVVWARRARLCNVHGGYTSVLDGSAQTTPPGKMRLGSGLVGDRAKPLCNVHGGYTSVLDGSAQTTPPGKMRLGSGLVGDRTVASYQLALDRLAARVWQAEHWRSQCTGHSAPSVGSAQIARRMTSI
jgi:hypothetical protein